MLLRSLDKIAAPALLLKAMVSARFAHERAQCGGMAVLLPERIIKWERLFTAEVVSWQSVLNAEHACTKITASYVQLGPS